MGLSATVLLFDMVTLLLSVVARALMTPDSGVPESPADTVMRVAIGVAVLATIAVLISSACHSLSSAGFRRLARATVWLLQVMAWVLVIVVLIRVIQDTSMMAIVARVREIVGVTLVWALIVLGTYIAAIGAHGVLVEPGRP